MPGSSVPFVSCEVPLDNIDLTRTMTGNLFYISVHPWMSAGWTRILNSFEQFCILMATLLLNFFSRGNFQVLHKIRGSSSNGTVPWTCAFLIRQPGPSLSFVSYLFPNA